MFGAAVLEGGTVPTIYYCANCGQDISDWVPTAQIDDCNCPHCGAGFDFSEIQPARIKERIKGIVVYLLALALAGCFIFGLCGQLFQWALR